MEYELYQVHGELTHHGIKGMRWGIRRYQNKDGSLTAAGRKRYDAEMEKVKAETKKIRNQQRTAKKLSKLDEAKKKLADLKKSKKSAEDEAAEKKKNEETDEQKKERILKNPTAKDVYENRHLFSNKEVGELQLRLLQEENIKKLIPPEKDPRKERADKLIKNVEDLTAKGIALGKAYNLGATIFNAFSPAGAKLAPKLDLDNLNKGNKEQRKKDEAEAKKDAKERADAAKKAADEAKAAKKAAKDAKAAAKAQKTYEEEMRKYEEYNKAWTEEYKSTPSSTYRGEGSGSSERVRNASRISGLLGSGSTATNKAVSNLPAVVSRVSSDTSNRGQSVVAGLLGSGSSSNSFGNTSVTVLRQTSPTRFESDNGFSIEYVD